MLSPRRPAWRHAQRGMSLIELMVGITIGLIIVAAASLLMTSQLVENRRLITETQVQQDLRAATDLMAREMRRVGAVGESQVLGSLWYPGAPGSVTNPFAPSLVATTGVKVDFNYHPGVSANTPGPFGFELQGTAVKSLIRGVRQELTDPNVMRVTSLTPSVSTDSSATILMPCPTICPAGLGLGDTGCWPKYRVRRTTIGLQAEARNDANVKRTMSSTVRVRNDYVVFSNAVANQMCPA